MEFANQSISRTGRRVVASIAAHARLTPGAIYRRFSDKDALVESVIMDIVARQDRSLRSDLTQEMARQLVSTPQDLVTDAPDADYWRDLLPRNDEALRLELTRALLSYLGAERPA